MRADCVTPLRQRDKRALPGQIGRVDVRAFVSSHCQIDERGGLAVAGIDGGGCAEALGYLAVVFVQVDHEDVHRRTEDSHFDCCAASRNARPVLVTVRLRKPRLFPARRALRAAGSQVRTAKPDQLVSV